MKTFLKFRGFLAITLLVAPSALAADDKARLAELDAYWVEASRTVKEGDFAGYSATFHEAATLVSGSSKTSYPIAKALARWKQGFADTKAGKIKASVEFRFSQRIGDATTAHETGIFIYSTVDADGKATKAYIHFEALLVKRESWKMMMEYQKSKATAEEWEKLK